MSTACLTQSIIKSIKLWREIFYGDLKKKISRILPLNSHNEVRTRDCFYFSILSCDLVGLSLANLFLGYQQFFDEHHKNQCRSYSTSCVSSFCHSKKKTKLTNLEQWYRKLLLWFDQIFIGIKQHLCIDFIKVSRLWTYSN